MQGNVGKSWFYAIFVMTRCSLLGVTEVVAGIGLFRLTRPCLAQVYAAGTGQSSPAEWPLERVVVDASAVLASLAYAGLAASSFAVLIGVLLGGRRWAVGAGAIAGPQWWRRMVLVACGLGLAAPIAAGPSWATDHGRLACTAACAPSQSTRGILSGLQLPDLPAQGRAQRAREPRIVIRPGDSLWLIARDMLPADASDAAVSRAVHRLYAVNRRTIGTDPDLIYPGTTLSTPGGTP